LARKILLADDSVTAQNMGRKILTDAGYEVVTVNNGSAALKKVSEAQPELIVLDVYMPGYSGLEVCQRIKDSRETSHIPVLLTVGKLEPFKQDEARRVRADAFIIKPFEASELMAAVSKLENKLGTAPAQRKDGRHSGPVTMESFERTAAAGGPRYGDEESGWKSRIKFPGSGPKRSEPEPEPEPEAYKPASSGEFCELISEKPPATSPAPAMPDRPIPAGIPQDITPDEIAAIAAAAARVKGGIFVGKNFERLTDESKLEQKTQAPPAEEAKVEKPDTVPTPVAGETTTREVAESPVSSQRSSETKPGTSKEGRSQQAVSEATASSSTAEKRAAVQPVETVAPTLSVTASSQISEPASAAAPIQGSEDEEPVTVAAVGPAPEISSAPGTIKAVSCRWVAEEIPVDAAESALVLEREMHKAFAAFAAAEYGQAYKSAPVDRDDEPMFATMAPPTIGAPLPMMESSSVADTDSSKDEAKTDEPAGSSAPVSPVDLQEMSSTSEVSKPPAPPFASAGPADDDSGHAVVAFGGPNLMGGPESTGPTVTAQVTSPATPPVDNRPATLTSESSAAEKDGIKTQEAAKDQREAQLAASTAAAFANWREVRDSVLGSKSTPEVSPAAAGTPSAELKEIKGLKQDEPTQPETAMAAAASAESSATDPNLSSIVDNMLAELKPKLMAELAEKLKKEKSKK
jgi:twitching motility two-component system response regulator PilH